MTRYLSDFSIAKTIRLKMQLVIYYLENRVKQSKYKADIQKII